MLGALRTLDISCDVMDSITPPARMTDGAVPCDGVWENRKLADVVLIAGRIVGRRFRRSRCDIGVEGRVDVPLGAEGDRDDGKPFHRRRRGGDHDFP